MLANSFDWALVDVETSGLRPAEHRVLSIAVLTIGRDGRQEGEFSSLVNPDCDPGPVHIHGLSVERLAGAPRFDHIADQVAALLDGRVMVAHNAPFDYNFLAREFDRARVPLPVKQRLCTVALNRRVAPPTTNLRLDTLAAHYGVTQRRAHDAVDDTRVLAGILHGSLAAAARLGLTLPLVSCPPERAARSTAYPPRIPKVRCPFRNPGRLPRGGPLVQGMKIAITGDTRTPRTELAAQASAVGLNVMSSVSRHTSVLITNDPRLESSKARRARDEDVPVIDEDTFLHFLSDIRPGAPYGEPDKADPIQPQPTGVHPAPPDAPVPATVQDNRPLADRRVLVLGGSHERAADARARVTELGGAAAVNLSASVTDVVALAGSDADRRLERIRTLGMPLHDESWLGTLGPGSPEQVPSRGTAVAEQPAAPFILVRGAVIDLPVMADATRWTLTASWAQQTACEVDLVAFAVDADEQVCGDEDFVFYGAPEGPDDAVTLSADGPTEQTIVVNLSALSRGVRKVVVAAAIDGAATFGDVGAVEIYAAPGTGERPLAQATLDAATTERTMLLAEIYRRGPSWRLRAIGQGYDHGLADLARAYGVDIED